MTVLRAEALRVRRGSLEILRGVDLSVCAGRVLAVLGPSGAGKSTLFRTLVGDLPPSHGRVLLDERDITRAPLWARARLGIGYVPQTPSVLWDLTVAENIATYAALARVTAEVARTRADELSLGALFEVRARALSGGERRRLELLRALLSNPKVLVLDEPLSGLDPAGAASVARVLRARAEQGMGILLADHRVGEALALCHDAVLLADGQVELRTPAAEFAEHPAVVRRYLG
ncbi:MAG TPA: ATP-binding cassette domain-containing protein [Polyangiaceae bacterium]